MQNKLAGPRYKLPISDAELARRLAAVRAAMAREGIDCVLTQTQNLIFDSGIRYFLDCPTGGYTAALMIPAVGGLIYISHGPDLGDVPPPAWARNMEKMILKPFCPPFGFTDDLAARAAEREIRARGFKKLGLYMPQCMSLSFGEYLKTRLRDLEFVDFSARIKDITAVKSAEEWELIYGAVAVHDKLMAAVPALVRPGRMEFEVRADLEHLALDMGADDIGNVAVGSAAPGTPCMFYPHFSANRRIEPGDNVIVILEVSGPGGFYGELARTFSLGEPERSLVRLFETARDCQRAVAVAARPGVTGSELNEVFNSFVTPLGIAPNLRFAGHGQGYDMMESPAICAAEDMPLREDMLFAIHPELTLGNDFANCCDNFRITKDGAVLLNRTPQEIIRL